jgi:Domain of unknown function (DUF4386)
MLARVGRHEAHAYTDILIGRRRKDVEKLCVERSSKEAGDTPDPSWRGLYWAGSVAAVLYVILIVAPLVLLIIVPPPPSSGGAATLLYIASHKAVYLIELVSFVGLSVPAIVVFMALYEALKHLNKSYAAIGAIIAIASEVIALALNDSPPSLNGGLVYLSDQYMTATTAAQHVALATAAESLIAVTNAVASCGILTALGILILSLVMLKGVFNKGVAYLGIITGVLGIFSEALRPFLSAPFILYGVLLPTWFLAVGWKLYRLGSSSSPSSSDRASS